MNLDHLCSRGLIYLLKSISFDGHPLFNHGEGKIDNKNLIIATNNLKKLMKLHRKYPSMFSQKIF